MIRGCAGPICDGGQAVFDTVNVGRAVAKESAVETCDPAAIDSVELDAVISDGATLRVDLAERPPYAADPSKIDTRSHMKIAITRTFVPFTTPEKPASQAVALFLATPSLTWEELEGIL